jgi:large subunit ribosomal protein L25
MANIIDVSANIRTATGTGAVNRLRKSGAIPAVVYGRGRDNLNVQLDSRSFTKIINHSASDNILVNLQIDSGNQLALVQEVQHDHIKGGIIHVDFHAVNENEDIHAAVPVELVGEAAGLKFGGLLELLVHALEVHCLPKDLPEKIQIDVAHLKVGDAIHVSEVTLPKGVSTRIDGSVIVAHLVEPKVEEAAPAAPAADAKGAKAPAADAKAAPAKK